MTVFHPLAIAITVVLGIVIFSYRQTIHAYPDGASAYIVASKNLGKYPGLVAASALLIDYVLTVAVSITAGVDAIVSLAPDLQPLPRADRGRRDRHHHAAQPARRAGVGRDLRHADVRLHLADRLPGDRGPPSIRRRAAVIDPHGDARGRLEARSRSSSSCGRTPTAAPRSPVSRPYPTACRPSASPWPETRRPPSCVMGVLLGFLFIG